MYITSEELHRPCMMGPSWSNAYVGVYGLSKLLLLVCILGEMRKVSRTVVHACPLSSYLSTTCNAYKDKTISFATPLSSYLSATCNAYKEKTISFIGKRITCIESSMKLILPKLFACRFMVHTTAYVAQTAWIQSGIIMNNILFGLPINK